jgi:hypothetical protein
MAQIGKLLVLFGMLVAAVGLALIILARINFPLGRLPGDLIYRNKHTTVYLPLATSLLLGALLSLVLYLLSRFRK